MQTPHTESARDPATVAAIIEAHQGRPGAMLPILHAIQDSLGHIPADAVPLIADALNVSRAEVHGVITYYDHFRQQPAAKHVVQLCRAEACQARGADALAGHVRQTLGCDFHGTSADGKVTLEPVYCLGHCAVGPNIAIDDKPYARVSTARFDALLQACGGER
jgi:formate dehydrogenase subunit gamma